VLAKKMRGPPGLWAQSVGMYRARWFPVTCRQDGGRLGGGQSNLEESRLLRWEKRSLGLGREKNVIVKGSKKIWAGSG